MQSRLTENTTADDGYTAINPDPAEVKKDCGSIPPVIDLSKVRDVIPKSIPLQPL